MLESAHVDIVQKGWYVPLLFFFPISSHSIISLSDTELPFVHFSLLREFRGWHFSVLRLFILSLLSQKKQEKKTKHELKFQTSQV